MNGIGKSMCQGFPLMESVQPGFRVHRALERTIVLIVDYVHFRIQNVSGSRKVICVHTVYNTTAGWKTT